jgi:hypothetical protein
MYDVIAYVTSVMGSLAGDVKGEEHVKRFDWRRIRQEPHPVKFRGGD